MDDAQFLKFASTASYTGNLHQSILDTFSIDYFERSRQQDKGLIRLYQSQKDSVFGSLLYKTYKASGVKNWRLIYTPQNVTGDFNLTPFKGYVIEGTPAVTEDATLKKYVWAAQEGAAQNEDTLLYIIAHPTPMQLRVYEDIQKIISEFDDISETGGDIKSVSRSIKLEDDLAPGTVRTYITSSKTPNQPEFRQGATIPIQSVSECYTQLDKLYRRVFAKNGIKQCEALINDYNANFLGKSLHIYGFTCAAGGEQFNEQLAERRALFIKYMVSHGVTPTIVNGQTVYPHIPLENITKSVGYGEAKDLWETSDVDPNLAPKDREPGTSPKNRRVEIYVTNPVLAKETSYTVWEDWNTPVPVRHIDDLKQRYPFEA